MEALFDVRLFLRAYDDIRDVILDSQQVYLQDFRQTETLWRVEVVHPLFVSTELRQLRPMAL